MERENLKFSKPITVKKKLKPIAQKSKNNKNTIRKLTKTITEQVYKRDWYKCIIKWCYDTDLDPPHHIFYWINAEYWEDRNNINKLVTLCKKHHYQIHHWSWWKKLNEECKLYINNLK